MDRLGSPILATDAAGLPRFRPRHDAWGRQYAGRRTDDMRLDYTGHFADGDSGLVDMGFRWYDPLARRFTTEDPIKDGSNWYAYCGGDPVNYTDPDGLATFAHLLFDKGNNTITVTTFNDDTGHVRTRVFNASNNVVPKTDTAGNAILDSTSPGKEPYIRQPFPDGPFKVIGVRPGTIDAEGTYVIKTDAHQTVATYESVVNPVTGLQETQPSGTTTDWGYNFHDGKGSFTDWESQTQGCGRIETSTGKYLTDLYGTVDKSGGNITGFAQE